MILEFFIGVFVSILAIISFLSLNYMKSINKWIIVTSKFIYFSGHPLLDDDQIFEEISKRFKNVFSSLVIVIFKTILFLVIILILIGVSSLFIALARDIEIPNIGSQEFISSLFPKYLIQFPFILGSLIPVFLVPLFLNKRNKKKDVYSPIDKFLHYIFLGNKNIAKFLFKIELWIHKKQLNKSGASQNVYISGLARAGTTVLMQYLGQLSEFKSLSYRNLPFLFIPKTGLKLISKRKTEEKERFHQDGMTHSLNSYEALEEPFWRDYIGEKYIFDKIIQKHIIDQKVFEKYNAFRKLVAGDKVYLAKNNNHLLRAASLHKLDKAKGNNTITIIPFRDPYGQAKSLLKQHLLLSKLQKEDGFTLDYMDFLVHHEFGLHTKQPVLDNNNIQLITDHKDSLEYWLKIWYVYYEEVYKQFSNKENFHFFNYNSFVEDPYNSLANLIGILDISEKRINSITLKKFTPKEKIKEEIMERKYTELYNKMDLITINK